MSFTLFAHKTNGAVDDAAKADETVVAAASETSTTETPTTKPTFGWLHGKGKTADVVSDTEQQEEQAAANMSRAQRHYEKAQEELKNAQEKLAREQAGTDEKIKSNRRIRREARIAARHAI